MVLLIGVSGFAGAGKSTAVDYLKRRCAWDVVYLGSAVLEEVRKRGLPETRDSEGAVRLELRRTDLAAIAKLNADAVSRSLKGGVPVIIDAIMCLEEYEFLSSHIAGTCAYLLTIEAPVAERCKRLSVRINRPFTPEDVEARDRTEIETLGIDRVFTSASHTIVNDRSIAEFQASLDAFLEGFMS